MTARETISLMALHGLAAFTKNFEEFTKYKWFGGLRKEGLQDSGTFSNMYYKILYGKTYYRGNFESFDSPYFIGDRNGDPVNGTAFVIHCHSGWNDPHRKMGGPCHFRPTHPGNTLRIFINCISKHSIKKLLF